MYLETIKGEPVHLNSIRGCFEGLTCTPRIYKYKMGEHQCSHWIHRGMLRWTMMINNPLRRLFPWVFVHENCVGWEPLTTPLICWKIFRKSTCQQIRMKFSPEKNKRLNWKSSPKWTGTSDENQTFRRFWHFSGTVYCHFCHTRWAPASCNWS